MKRLVLFFAVVALALCSAVPAEAANGRGILGIRGRIRDRIAAGRGLFGIRGRIADRQAARGACR